MGHGRRLHDGRLRCGAGALLRQPRGARCRHPQEHHRLPRPPAAAPIFRTHGARGGALPALFPHIALVRSRKMNHMATAKKPNEAETSDFVISRTFDAPRALVWKAWTDPEALAQWWGPKGATIRVVKLDMRPGGIFHYAMSFQPGHDMWGRFAYREIAPPERLV